MNDTEFKRHLKDLVHGHHHPEEHDWGQGAAASAPRKKASAPKRRAAKRTAKRK